MYFCVFSDRSVWDRTSQAVSVLDPGSLCGMFQGAVQSMSRSYYAKIIPAEKSGEYFGIYDICGKGASFMGTILVSAVSQITGSVNLGVGALSVMFLAGFFLFLKADKTEKARKNKKIQAYFSAAWIGSVIYAKMLLQL